MVIHDPLKKLPEGPQHHGAELARTAILGDIRNLTFFIFQNRYEAAPEAGRGHGPERANSQGSGGYGYFL